MFRKRIFTISIGDHGIVVALHNGKDVQNKILVASISDENKPQLESLLTSNSSVPIYIILDTNNQSYKKKTYPPVNLIDFHKIVKRDLNKEFGSIKKSFYGYYGAKDKIQNKWDCTFVSVALSSEIDKWIEFLLNMPNRLVGVYALPAETSIFSKLVFDAIKVDKKIKTNENTVFSFIVQNKVSGIRQIVFANQSIIFTRVVNYDFDDPNFPAQFEQDTFRANEYLKMIFPKLGAQDVVIVNLLSDNILDKIKHIKDQNFNFINFSPYQIAKKLGITNAVSKNNSHFSDILIANCFANNPKKVLKFSNPKITLLERFNLSLKSILVANIIIICIPLAILVKIISYQYQFNNKIPAIINERSQIVQKLQSINEAALDRDSTEKADDKNTYNTLANEIIDFGKIDETLSAINVNISSIFNRLAIIKKHDLLVLSFSYNFPQYNPKVEMSSSTKTTFTISGEITDKSGDIEIIFKKFDALNLETKNKFPKYNVSYSEISKNIDFSKKYYSFPFNLTLENKGQVATDETQ